MKKVLAFDIGGTNTRLALVNEKFKIENSLYLPTNCSSKERFLETIFETVKLLNPNFDEIVGAAAGLPGVVDKKTGHIIDLPNVHVSDIPLSQLFKDKYNLDLFLGNDAEFAGLAEATRGKGKNKSRVFFITISTGLGGALIIDNEVQDYVTEIGHTITFYQNKPYEFEELVSGTGIVKLCKLNKLSLNSSKEFFSLIKNKDELALKVYKEWLIILTKFLTLVDDSYHPEIFTITGGVTKAKDIWLKDLRKLNPHLKIELCHFKEEAGLIGSAVCAFSKPLK